MKRFDLYSSSSATLNEVGSAIEQHLGIELSERESGYLGGIYFRFTSDEERIMVQTNLPDDEGYRQESDLSEQAILVYVSRSNRWGALEELLTAQCALELVSTDLV